MNLSKRETVLRAQIQKLEAENAELKKRIETLEFRINLMLKDLDHL